jgi:hypothetical protein
VLGLQQIAVGGLDKSKLRKLWVDTLGLHLEGNYKSEKENVDEDIAVAGRGPFRVEVDLMQPIDPEKKPKVNDPALNHVGLWVDNLAAAVEWLGFTQPDLQVTFRSASGDRDRVDFLWRDGPWSPGGVAGEADGDVKYDGRFGDAAEVHRRQQRRDGRLRRFVSTVPHWGWTDATNGMPLRSILLGAGLIRTAPEDTASLAAMTRAIGSRAPHRTA